MGGGQELARNLHEQEPGRDNRYAKAAGNLKVAPKRSRRHCAGIAYIITPGAGEPICVVVSGRVQWALDRLRAAGPDGCTPLSEPAPRWAAYVHRLREMGVEIETVTEPHSGCFPGHHARYVLCSGAVRSAEGGGV